MFKNRSPYYGFRLSMIDLVVLILATVGTMELCRRDHALWWMLPCVVGHFFLFCNVFRVRRAYELIWAAVFVLNVGFWMSRLSLDWQPPVLSQLLVTVVVLALEIRSPEYHGILAKRLNPRLQDYLHRRI